MFSRSTITFILSAALLLPLQSALIADESELSPDEPYRGTREKAVAYDVDLSAVVTPPYKAKMLRVWVPLAPSDSIQTITEGELYSFPMNVKPQIAAEPLYGNRFAYFEFKAPQGAQMIRHTFKVKTHEVRWNVEPAKVQAVEKWPRAFAPYLRAESQAVVVNDAVNNLIDQVLPERKGPYADFLSVIAWADKNLVYDHVEASLAASSQHALEKRRGHCSDYHGLCAAFGRAINAPTRVTYGINPFPKNSPSHCKLEAFLPLYGWVSFDVSETQKMISDITKDEKLAAEQKEKFIQAAQRRLASGFRDNTWFLQTRGTDYDLAPPAARRAAVVRTIYAEADGEALPEPDPGNAKAREFAWMTLHHYKADHQWPYPYKDLRTLEAAK